MMKYLEYKLSSGGFINRFLTAGVFTRESPFRKTVLQGRVNEWLTKDPSIHDNPCRMEVVKGRIGNIPPYVDLSGLYPGDELKVFGKRRKLKVYFTFRNESIYDSS